MKTNHLLLISALLFSSIFLFSCQSYKQVPYFQDLNRTSATNEAITNFSPLTIQRQDILAIHVSSLNPQAYSDSSNRQTGYNVDAAGNVTLPLIGNIKAEGLTTSALASQIQLKLKSYLKEPSVTVKMISFKISVLGDVAKPDVYKIQTEHVTLTEALSMAGDLNITARRTNLLLVRELNGKREYITLDLTSADIFHSPYFYLKPNDLIYVQPDKTKYATVDRSYTTISLILSGLSVIAIVITQLINK